MIDVSDGHVHPAGSLAVGAERVSLTPERAGWTYSGLRVIEFTGPEPVRVTLDEAEAVLLPLSARDVEVRIDDRDGHHDLRLAGRTDVFTAVSDFAYAGRGSRLELAAPNGGLLAIATAQCDRFLPARYQPASAVPVELRGAGQCSRQVNNFAAAGVFEADRLIAVEVLTPGGNWSSYPPHKHDEDVPGQESVLEEVYYFRIRGADGRTAAATDAAVGYQRVYASPGRPIDVLTPVHTGDVVTMPHGWHGPSMATPGYDMYYLNVMAGPSPERAWLIRDDPDHAWIRDTWADQLIDPRLPMSSPEEDG